MNVAPGTLANVQPEDIIRGKDETDEAYDKRQALLMELWSIPDNS